MRVLKGGKDFFSSNILKEKFRLNEICATHFLASFTYLNNSKHLHRGYVLNILPV